MEINFINEDFFKGGVVPSKMYHEALQKGRNVSLNLTINETKYKVYIPELFNILNAKEIPLKDGRIIDGTIYVQDYINGYNKGIEYFKQEYPETHLMINSDLYFSALHFSFFHKAPNFKFGWNYWINTYPLSIHSKAIEEYGFCASIKLCLDQLKEKNPTLFKKFENCEHDFPTQNVEKTPEQKTVELKPMLNTETVKIVYDLLKDFFSHEHQIELERIIETGSKSDSKLLFRGSGNRLTDTFKKLFEHNFIKGCQKKDLIKWIISNFNFIQHGITKPFIYDTVEKIISRNHYPCKSPLIEIKNGQIQKVEQPRKRKQSKY